MSSIDSPEILDTLRRPLRDLRLSVTDKCNFRCPYCMPVDVYGDDHQFSPKAEILTFEELERLTRLFVRLGAEKIRITGGEPLIRKGLTALLTELKAIPGVKDLTLTTNGWFLAEQAQALKAAGLDRITVSLDSLDEGINGRMNGRGHGPQRVLEGVSAALDAGLTPIKLNVVLKRSENMGDIVSLAGRFRNSGVIVRYIEFMDVGTRNDWRMDEVVPSAEVVEAIHARWPLEPAEQNYVGEVASRYRYQDGGGEIGVISSITQPFCGECTRARLTTNGELFTCLFATEGVNLRDPLRAGASDNELLELITGTWKLREDRYSEIRTEHTNIPGRKRVEMYQVGG